MYTARQNVIKDKKKLEEISKNLKDHSYLKEDLASEIQTELSNNSGIARVKIGENQENLLMLIIKANISVITKQLITSLLRSTTAAEIFLQDNLGNNALMHAAMVNNIDFLNEMSDPMLGNSLDVKNKDNKTPFMLAAQLNHKVFIEKILERKFNLSKENIEKSFLLAAENEHYEIVSLLKKEYPERGFCLTLTLLFSKLPCIPENQIKNLLKFSSGITTGLVRASNYLEKTRLSSIIHFFQITGKFLTRFIENKFVNHEAEKFIIQTFYGDSGQHSLLEMAEQDEQDQDAANPESSEQQNGGNTYQATALELEKRKNALLIAKAEFAEATPEQKQDKEKLVGLCEGAVLRAEAALREIRIKREEEELYRSPVRPEIPPTYFNSAPPRRRRTSRSGSIVLSTRTSTPQGIRRQKSRKINGSNHLSGGNRSLAHTSPFRGVERVPPLPLSTLPSQVAQAVSFTPGEPHSSSASSSQERPRNQQQQQLKLPKHP